MVSLSLLLINKLTWRAGLGMNELFSAESYIIGTDSI